MIIAIVMIMAMWFGMRLIPMVQTLDALSLASGPEYNEVIYHAVHGRWPPADNPYMIAGDGKGLYTNNLTLNEGGVITAQLALSPVSMIGAAPFATGAGTIHGSLSFRPELLGSRDAPTVSFLCGYAKPVVGRAATSGANKTTLERKFLPPFCR
ncbi:MAG: hypothetical protein ACREPH_10280 [Rhodanobacteraceae bacterium]